MSVTSSDSAQLTPNAIKRLKKDYKELIKEPLVGASADMVDGNLKEWNCIVIAQSGPYKGVPIIFALEFPSDYPVKAPHAYFMTKIAYRSGAQVLDKKGRQVICLDLFGNFASVHTEWGKDGQASGWSSSYSVKTILITMQGVLLDGQYLNPDPAQIEITKKSSEQLIKEYDFEIPDLDEEVTKNIVKENLTDNVKCYALGLSFKESILGYGINVSQRFISSPAEYLSLDAFESGIRGSTTNKPFNSWIVIFINESHFKKSEEVFYKYLTQIASKMGKTNAPIHEQIFELFSNVMNSLVVEIMNLGDNLSASDKFIDSYYGCYRTLLYISKKNRKLIDYCNEMISTFISGKTTKKDIPNLGTWLIAIILSDQYSWEDVKVQFIKEVDTRNFFWYAVGNARNPAKYPELMDPKQERYKKTFIASKVSRNLVCFQKKFIELTNKIDLDELDKNCGIVDEETKQTIKKIHKEVNKITEWSEYFIWNNIPSVNKNVRESQLLDAMKNSEKNGYHKKGQVAKSARPRYNRW
uniref:UBC core domain-containing protein n=1 Tax=viral metagenome TaxID=1070528 RepID=A0A6C0ACK1_9ZZZZ